MKKKEIIERLKSIKPFKGENLTIDCESISAIANIDVIELYLFLSGVKKWQWRDASGASVQQQNWLANLIHCVIDFICWPSLYLSIKFRLPRNQKVSSAQNQAQKSGNSIIFLRTDHWFNIKSGGSVGHLSGVINGFHLNGYTTEVISTDNLVDVHTDDHFLRIIPKYSIGRNLPNMPEMLFSFYLFKSIINRKITNDAFIIYQRYSLGNCTGVLLSRKLGIPYVCEYNGSFPWMSRHWEGRTLFHEKIINEIELLNLRAAKVIVVVSKPMKDELIARGIEAAKILVNPNGVDPKRYSPLIDGSAVRIKYGIQDCTVIGFIGTFGKWHGAEKLTEAFGLLLKAYPQYRSFVRLLLIGDGVMMGEVKRLIEVYTISAECMCTGQIPQDEGPAHLAACDILASPHVSNPDGTPFFGSPTKLFEYMAMGKPIVASDLDQIGEILKHRETAWMVKPGDTGNLMQGLKMIIDNKELGDSMGAAARKTVEKHYTWEQHTQRIIDKLLMSSSG
jgi:glycosyltransferase involved in cell wall biosynthesis